MFNQLTGIAMGHVFAPQYACLVIGYLEEHKLFPDILLDHFPPDIVTMIETYYWRYMDDGNALLPKCVDSVYFYLV